jgi:transposase-like protein
VEPDPLTVVLRGGIRELIETVVDAELTAVRAAGQYERGTSWQGYRRPRCLQRTLTTGLGATALTLPRARRRRGSKTV